VTTSGDNKGWSKEETKSLLLDLMPKRFGSMAIEAQWALGFPVPENFVTPPDWVKNVILDFNGIPRVKPDKPTQLTSEVISSLVGMSTGLAEAGTLFFAQEMARASSQSQSDTLIRELISRVDGPLKEQVGKLEAAISSLPPTSHKATVKDLAAYSSARSEAIASVASDEDATITKELTYWFWVLWPQVSTATSIPKVHQWITGTGLIHCSDKLVEKVCRELGFRATRKKRKKRIPTTRKKQ
jgi:hypothetical protein